MSVQAEELGGGWLRAECQGPKDKLVYAQHEIEKLSLVPTCLAMKENRPL